MKQVCLAVALLACSLLGAFATQALAQEATMVGTISDPSDAAIPGATITITKAGTGQARTIISDTVGQYVAPDLTIGR